MTRREQLQEQYEDSLFALLMDEIAKVEGERLLEENERLKQDPNAAVPEAVMRRCRKTINREFSKKNAAALYHTSIRVFNRIAVLVFVGILLFTGAFATSENLRINTLNLMIEVFDRNTEYRFGQHSQPKTGMGFEIGWLPEGFVLVDQERNNTSIWENYENANGDILHIELTSLGENGVISIDTEKAIVEEIFINEQRATLFTKDYYRVVIPIPEKQQLFLIDFFSEISEYKKDEFLRIVESITLYQ